MAQPMKISDVTEEVMAAYLKEDYESMEDDSKVLLSTMMAAAKNHISSMTGIPQVSEDSSSLDDIQECVIAFLVLVGDMWDNGNLYVDKNNVNKTVEAILNGHCVNLL